MVAARTAVEEAPQVVHKRWEPRPRVRKAGRRNWRLVRALASAAACCASRQ